MCFFSAHSLITNLHIFVYERAELSSISVQSQILHIWKIYAGTPPSIFYYVYYLNLMVIYLNLCRLQNYFTSINPEHFCFELTYLAKKILVKPNLKKRNIRRRKTFRASNIEKKVKNSTKKLCKKINIKTFF